MNKRIKKKKYNKWETARVYNITVSFEDVPFVWDAFCAQNKLNWEEFAVSRNAMKAVKSYCKKNVWNTGACDNVRDMYRCMCEEIHADREYRKRIAEQIREEDVRNATADWEQQERTQQAFTAEWFRDAGCPDMEHATEMFVDLYNDINS